jgi:hypothetical protein
MVFMKKRIIAGITVTACVALCAAVWLLRSQVRDLATEPLKTSVNAGFEAWPEETSKFVSYADTHATKAKTARKNRTAGRYGNIRKRNGTSAAPFSIKICPCNL